MKYFGALLIAALFLAVPLTTAYHYAPAPHYGAPYHDYYGGADIVFRGEVTRIQRLGGSDPRVEVTFRVRDRIRGNPSSTIVVTLPRYRDGWGHFYDNNPFTENREYVVGVRRSDNRNRLLWFEPATHYRPPRYHPPVYQPPVYRPPTSPVITIPNPHTTNTCSVLEVSGQVVIVCPSQQSPSRLDPLLIGTPQPTVHIVDAQPRVPIAAFPWLH